MLVPTVHHGKDTTHKSLETMCNARAWPHVGRAVKFLTTLQYIFSYSVIHLSFVFKSPPQYSLDYLYQIQLSPKEHHTAGPFPCKRR